MDRGPDYDFPGMVAALSQPTRIKIVEIIAAGPKAGVAAGDIARSVNCPPSTLSFHLKELSVAGLAVPEPEGRFIRYRLVPAAFEALSRFISALPGPPLLVLDSGKTKPSRRKARPPDTGQMSIF